MTAVVLWYRISADHATAGVRIKKQKNIDQIIKSYRESAYYFLQLDICWKYRILYFSDQTFFIIENHFV